MRRYKNWTHKIGSWGLPWWHSGWESACQCRGHGYEPWSGKIPHATEQLGPWATTTEPARLEPVLRNKRGCDSERPAHRDEEWPPLVATRESPRTETKTQHRPKINKFIKKKKKIGSWKYLTIWRPVLPVFPRAQSASFHLSTLNSFQGGVENQQLQQHMI